MKLKVFYQSSGQYGIIDSMENVQTVYNVKVENFEGPFDLLLHLIEKNKLEIMEISINDITDQYMDYLYGMDELDLEITSDFLVIASTLLHIKSRKLLPKPAPQEEEVTEEELKRRLVHYKKVKGVSALIAKRMEEWEGAFYPSAEPIEFPKREEHIELNMLELKNAYIKVKVRELASRNDNSEKMKEILKVEKVSLRDKMTEVVKILYKRSKAVFSQLFNVREKSKTEVVTGFMAILELNKNRKLIIEQKKAFGDILLKKGAAGGSGSGLEALEGEYYD